MISVLTVEEIKEMLNACSTFCADFAQFILEINYKIYGHEHATD